MLKARKVLSLFAGLALFCFAAFGQTTLSSTTLSSAVSAYQKTVVLASVSAVTIPGVPNGTTLGGPVAPYSYMDLVVDSEVMRIVSVNGTSVNVMRGNAGTRAFAHNSGSLVYVTRPANLANYDLSGSCTINSSLVVPQINPNTGHVFNCMAVGASGLGQWGSYFGGIQPVVGAAITGAATIAPTANVSHITGTVALSTITVPAGMPSGGSLTLIFDAGETWNASGNIFVASAAAQTAGESMTLTFDSATSKWYPSHL